MFKRIILALVCVAAFSAVSIATPERRRRVAISRPTTAQATTMDRDMVITARTDRITAAIIGRDITTRITTGTRGLQLWLSRLLRLRPARRRFRLVRVLAQCSSPDTACHPSDGAVLRRRAADQKSSFCGVTIL